MNSIIKDFEKFCKTPNRNSGKASSYAHAIKYLCEFLKIEKINEQTVKQIQDIELLIKDNNSSLYKEMLDFLSNRGQVSYLVNGFIKAALPLFFRFYSYYSETVEVNDMQKNIIISQELKDSDINVEFFNTNLKRELPVTNLINEHDYSILRRNGTSKESLKKIKSGRKAEKYFIKYLNSLDFVSGIDFKDVANDKDYGFDILLFDIGLEVKNISSGAFYLTDNEIAYLDRCLTHIILVDINNGIWLLKNNSNWLKESVFNIKKIREYCKTFYTNLDVESIKIYVDEKVKEDLIELTGLPKEQVLKIFN